MVHIYKTLMALLPKLKVVKGLLLCGATCTGKLYNTLIAH